MTASDSSSSGDGRPRAAVDLAAAGLLPPLPAAFLDGDDLDLLDPLRLQDPAGTLPAAAVGTDRAAVARELATTNQAYGHPAAERLAELLADPETRVVVTGQQPGLLGGPLYALSKAVAAVLWAERLEQEGGRAVPLFWVANEDHDFREVARADFPTPEGTLSLDLGEDPSPLLPVGMRTLGEPMAALLERLGERLPGERWAAWLADLAGRYRPDVRFGEAFCRQMVYLLGQRCPLMVDSMLPAMKSTQRSWLRRLVEARAEVTAVMAERDRAISERGYRHQVDPRPESSPLFLLRGGERRRIEWRGSDRYALRGAGEADEPVESLLDIIEENPAVVSPGALARPVIQDAVLGTALHVLGPGELSYFPQAAPLFALLGVPAPAVVARPQMMVLEAHQLAKLEGSEVTLEQLVAADLDIDRVLAGGVEGELLAPVREGVERLLEDLRAKALEIDPNLETPLRKTRGQVEKALSTFSGKLAASVARDREVSRRRVTQLREICRPQGKLQERVISSSYFQGKYGDRFGEALFEQLRLDPAALQVIIP